MLGTPHLLLPVSLPSMLDRLIKIPLFAVAIYRFDAVMRLCMRSSLLSRCLLKVHTVLSATCSTISNILFHDTSVHVYAGSF